MVFIPVIWIWAVGTMLPIRSPAQPLSCKEDAHCSEGYYCATPVHECRPCLQCHDMNRFQPTIQSEDLCIQSVESCGPCFEGFVNIYEEHGKGKCVAPELLQFESKSICVYVWMTAASAGALLVVVFVYVLKNTFVFRIVPNYDPVSIMSQSQVPVPVEQQSLKLKRILYFFKNANGQQ